MNQYTKHVWKRNITAIGIAALMVVAAIGVILVILTIGVLLGDYLPYVITTILLLGMVFVISLPIRDYLKDKENAKFWRDKKEKERLLMEADMEIDRLKKEADKEKRKVSEQIQAAHAVRKRDHLI